MDGYAILRAVFYDLWRLVVSGYLPVVIFLGLIVAFAVGSLAAAFVLRPSRPYASKLENYECGAEPIGEAWVQFPVGFYLVALIFIVFDALAVFLFPWGFVVTSRADGFLHWARKSSVWPVTFGLACCAIEMMATFASRFDVERLGMVPWASPRHSDLMIVSGTVTIKMAPMLKRIYDQMPDPKWVVSMGSCANSGGPFRHGYHVVKGVDRVVPVDVYVPGCPPTPDSLMYGLLKLQDQVAEFQKTGTRPTASDSK